MDSLTPKALEDMVTVIVQTVNPEKIILFGSRARGDSTTTSDIDLLIVDSMPFDAGRSRKKQMAKLWRSLAHFLIPKDILLYSSEEVEYWRDSLNSVVARALREGRTLYERPQASS